MLPMLPFLPLMPVVTAVHSLSPIKLYAGARALVTGIEVTLSKSSTPYLFSSPTPTLLDRSLASAFSAARWLPLPRLLVADFTASQFPALSAHAQAVAVAAAAAASRKRRALDRLARAWSRWATGAGAGWAKVAGGVKKGRGFVAQQGGSWLLERIRR